MDDDHSGTLDIQEFWKAMKDFRVRISQDECRRLFDVFDDNDDGVLDYDELILHIKGQMNAFRCSMVKKAFEKLDADRSGVLDVTDVKHYYDPSRHPDVKSGKITPDEALSNFLETFEAHRSLSKGDAASIKGDKRVTLNEFQDYYSNVSASIDDD